MSEKVQEVYRVAQDLFRQDPDWVTFFREVLGLNGVVRSAYASPVEMAEFEKTGEYNDIQVMVAKLREKNAVAGTDKEPTKVITVRLPQCLHESLRAEAHDRRTSMNQLCISKLLQLVDGELIPAEA